MQSKNAQDSALFWRTCAGLACVLLATFVMNVSIFPLFDDLFTYARDVSVFVNSVVLIALGLIAKFRPQWIRYRVLNATALALLVAGGIALVASFATEASVLMTTAACALAAARAWVTVLVGLSVSRMEISKLVTCVALAFVASYAAKALLWFVPTIASIAAFLLLPIAVLALVASEALSILQETQCAEAPADVAITQPSTLLPLASQLFVCLFLFRVAFGFSLRFGEVGGVPLFDFFVIVPVGVVAIVLVATSGKYPSADTVTQASVLCVVGGFFAVAALGTRAHAASVTMLSAGNALFDIVAWVVLAAVAGRNRSAAVVMFSWGRGVSGVGTIVGASIGVWATDALGFNGPAMEIVAGIIILVFVGYALIGLKKFSFVDTIMGVTPVVQQEPVAISAEEEFNRKCDELAQRFALSPREREVFAMLARGRNREYIQEQLVVSRNTVKAHVKHVYAKLGIHTHQELLDLVEGA